MPQRSQDRAGDSQRPQTPRAGDESRPSALGEFKRRGKVLADYAGRTIGEVRAGATLSSGQGGDHG
jgi:hypothetical protein